MRNTVLVLLLASAALADEAADLFYRAFWLEQAAGKSAEAEELYAKVVEAYPKAPEAPRALLGLIRIRAGRGEEVKEFVAILERDYPAAGEEIAEARRRLRREGRTPPFLTMDFSGLTEALGKAKKGDPVLGQIADMGAGAFEMLQWCLRATELAKVENATRVLLMQRQEDAVRLIGEALSDRSTPLRNTILITLAQEGCPASLVETVAGIYEGAPPRTREAVARVLRAVPARGGDAGKAAYPILTRALRDEDDTVRRAALVSFVSRSIRVADASKGAPEFFAYPSLPDAPDAYLEALVERVEARELQEAVSPLALLLGRSALSARIARLAAAASTFPAVPMEDDAGWRALAGAALDRYRSTKDLSGVSFCGPYSDTALDSLLRTALQAQDANLASAALTRRRPGVAPASLKGVFLLAVRAALDPAGAARQAAVTILAYFLPEPADCDAILAELEASPKAGLPLRLPNEFLGGIGIDKAARLASFAAGATSAHAGQIRQLLTVPYQVFGKQPSDARKWREVLLSRFVPSREDSISLPYSLHLGEDPGLAPAVASRLLAGEEPEWDWAELTAARPGPTTWREDVVQQALLREPLRSELLSHTADARAAVALTAIVVAKETEGERGLLALREALGGPREYAVFLAVDAFVQRGDPASLAVVGELLDAADAQEDRCSQAIRSLADYRRVDFAPRVAAYLRRRPLRGDDWAWLAKLHSPTCADLALELVDSPTREVREQALDALRHVDDPRRIEVYRAVLTGKREGDLMAVLATIGEQYIVELGGEALAHLRNPDGNIRQGATATIEKLRFYAEAKRSFEPTSR